MALIDRVYLAAAWVLSNARFTNVTGTPIVSVAESASGELVADEYSLLFSAVAGGTATITVSTASPNNPYSGRIITGVVVDGVTATITVVPGLSLVFSAATANANQANVFGGIYLGVFDASGVGAGVPSAGVQHQVTNNGASPVSAAKARLFPQVIVVKKTGQVFNFIKPFADGADEKIAGAGSFKTMPYAMKVIDVSGVGAAKIGTLQIDNVTYGAASILDLTTGASVSGTGLKAISPGYAYRILTGPLEGTEFALSSLVVLNDLANILVFPTRFVQIAPDVAGVAGTYAATTVTLTQSGQAAGVIQPSAVAYYWVRVLVPLGGVSESNPHPAFVALEASETQSAGWTV